METGNIELLVHNFLFGLFDEPVSRIKALQDIEEQTTAALQLPLTMLPSRQILMHKTGDPGNSPEFPSSQFRVIQRFFQILVKFIWTQESLI